MKKRILFLGILLVSNFTNAQNFQGQAFYEAKIFTKNDNQKENNSFEDEEFKKLVADAMKKASESTFRLDFNKFESVFEKEEKLEAPISSGSENMTVQMDMGDGGKTYKNIKTQLIIIEKNLLDKPFLIKDKLQNFDWKLSNETKIIGNYKCNKAELLIEVTQQQLDDYQKALKEQEIKKSNFFFAEKPKVTKIVAWYTDEIPINLGPREYWGLPGLILEVNDGKTTFLCSKIILNSKNKFIHTEPNKGKSMNQKEFDNLEKETYKKLNEQNEIEFNSNRK